MIWLIGNKGMLGNEISVSLSNTNFNIYESDIEIDITSLDQLKSFTRDKQIDWIINCSAYTNVDKAETEESIAKKINGNGVRNIALIAKELDAKLIHFSTDYVFDGNSNIPYKEIDQPNPKTAYGRTKLIGEIEIQKIISNYYVFRISWLYGTNGKNFVKTILQLIKDKDQLNIIDDQYGAPTYAKVLANNIVALINLSQQHYGIYHYSDDGEISWYNFACQIKDFALEKGIINRDVSISPISSKDYSSKTNRPKYSLLDKTKVRDVLNFEIYNWKKNLKEFIFSQENMSN